MSLQRALCATRHEPTKAGYTQELATKLFKGFAGLGIFRLGMTKVLESSKCKNHLCHMCGLLAEESVPQE